MNARRRVLALAVAGIAVAGTAAALRPAIARTRRSFETSSSPGARAYDLLAGAVLGGYYDDIAADCATTLDAVGVQSPSILEIGPGPGHLAERLLDLLPAARWTGIDIDPSMLATADARLRRRGLTERATLVEADVAALPFEDDAFDLVVTSFSAHHWPDPGRASPRSGACCGREAWRWCSTSRWRGGASRPDRRAPMEPTPCSRLPTPARSGASGRGRWSGAWSSRSPTEWG